MEPRLDPTNFHPGEVEVWRDGVNGWLEVFPLKMGAQQLGSLQKDGDKKKPSNMMNRFCLRDEPPAWFMKKLRVKMVSWLNFKSV